MRLSHYDKIKNSSFGYISEYLQKKEVLNQADDLTKEENLSISPKVILSSYMISLCPDDILSKERSPLEETLYQRSKELVVALEQETETLQSKCHDYKMIFDSWKSKDLASQLDIYLDLYDNYCKMEQTPEVNDLKQTIYLAIQTLAKEKTDQLIEEYVQTHQTRTIQASLVLQIQKQMKELYWKEKRELQTIDIPQIVEWLKDTKLLFHEVYDQLACANSEKEDFDEKMDIEFIDSQLQARCYNLNNLLHWLVDKVKTLDAPVHDPEYPAVHQSIDMSTNESYVTVVRFLFDRLEQIRDTLIVTRNE